MLSYPVPLCRSKSVEKNAKVVVGSSGKKMAAILPSQTPSDEPITKENKPKESKNKKESRSGGVSMNNKSSRPASSTSKPSPTMTKDAEITPKLDTATEESEKSFLLLDDKERLQVQNAEELIQRLGAEGQSSMKVLSIFGNTGDGKSHTLNHAFFGGEEVFKTSASQLSCTVGVWASYDSSSKCIILDTEGLLGMSGNQNQRTRLLLKVLATSDVIIYRTRAERLHTDLFTFLGDASEAYLKHFSKELQDATQRFNMNVPLCTLGPAVIIFHETQHTDLLGVVDEQTLMTGGSSRNPDDIIKQRFADVGRVPQAFSSIKYVGTRTYAQPTDFSCLKRAVKQNLNNNSVRSARSPDIIFKALVFLNEKFSGDVERTIISTFPDAYFTCQSVCLSCGAHCQQSMNHDHDNIEHKCDVRCQYQAQYDNRYFTCKACYEKGKLNLVIPKMCSATDSSWMGIVKYAWSGYVLECPECGIIFRSRQHWYGNRDPVETVVRPEIKHIWPGEITSAVDGSNVARRVLDGVKYVSQTVSSYSAPPSRVVTDWIADQVAPDYWVPNAQITVCHLCQRPFNIDEKKHHCRVCGQGFCDDCSSNKKPVPQRGWGDQPVRVCDTCFDGNPAGDELPPSCNLSELADALDDNDFTSQSDGTIVEKTFGPMAARKMIEGVQTAVETLGTALDFPREMLTDAARPSYWVPDIEITSCSICDTDKDFKHHCRSCGQGVCEGCSKTRRPVPSKGWDHPVRVCDKCVKKAGEKAL